MRTRAFTTSLVSGALALAMAASGQTIKRTDAIWARSTGGAAITLDGRLDEPVWAVAESIRIHYGEDTGIPGSGWKHEAGDVTTPTDPTDATLKFLVDGNNLYLGAVVRDSSVGGGLFNRFDGFLMNMRDHSKRNPDTHVAPDFEYFYGWVTESWADPATGAVGALPNFFGWADYRDPANRQIWDAATRVQGLSNADSVIDQGYTIEFRFNLTPRGYDVTRPQGDIIEFNVSIYDADWQWPFNAAKFYGNRVWWQNPWGNTSWYNVVRIHARPDVTVNSGPVPAIPPELVIPNGANFASPVIDGRLSEPVWQAAPSLEIAYGDSALQATYSSIGPWRSGWFQPAIGGVRAAILDTARASVHYFFKGDTLYLGFDVQDQVVTSEPAFDQYDGVNVTLNDRQIRSLDDHHLQSYDLIARVGVDGKVRLDGFLTTLDSIKAAFVALALKGSSTVNNPNDVDEGYSIELALDMKALGYPPGLGDGVLFLGITLLDGDSFVNQADNYGTRTWWFREHKGTHAPAWALMDPNALVTSVADRPGRSLPERFTLLGNYPNPFNPSTTIRYRMPVAGVVTLKVFDLLGRTAASLPLGLQQAGEHEVKFDAEGLSSGVYFYRLELRTTKASFAVQGKMLLFR